MILLINKNKTKGNKMPELIEISGNKVRYIRQEVLKEVGVEDFVAGIESSMG